MIKKTKIIALIILLLCSIGYCDILDDYKPTVVDDTPTYTILSYKDEGAHYAAVIYYSKIYLEARVEVYALDTRLNEADMAWIEFYHTSYLQKYFGMYHFEVADRKYHYSGVNFSKGTFHIYFRR